MEERFQINSSQFIHFPHSKKKKNFEEEEEEEVKLPNKGMVFLFSPLKLSNKIMVFSFTSLKLLNNEME